MSGAMGEALAAGLVEEAVEILWQARRGRRVIDGLPERVRPRTLADAYRIQDALAARLGPTAGWFVGCSNPLIQRQLGLDGPYYAPLIASTVHASPARLPASDYPSITYEVEFAFRIGRDLPSRPEPYSRAEVAEAVAAVHPSIELVTSCLADWTKQPILDLIADNGTDGALIHGTAVTDWRGIDLSKVATELEVDGVRVRRGSGADVLGDPLVTLTWLANALRERGRGLRADDICNTGSSTPMYVGKAGDRVVARFHGLGEVELQIETR